MSLFKICVCASCRHTANVTGSYDVVLVSNVLLFCLFLSNVLLEIHSVYIYILFVVTHALTRLYMVIFSRFETTNFDVRVPVHWHAQGNIAHKERRYVIVEKTNKIRIFIIYDLVAISS